MTRRWAFGIVVGIDQNLLKTNVGNQVLLFDAVSIIIIALPSGSAHIGSCGLILNA